MAVQRKKIDHYIKRLKALESERSEMKSYYVELSQYILGHKGRFLVTDRGAKRRSTKILNNTARLSARTLASGMMAGITSPARPWFKLATPDQDMMEFTAVKEWTHAVEKKMMAIFNQSNWYNTLHKTYSELGVFGTAPMAIYKDFENVIRCESYTVGSYLIATNGRHEVDTFYREYQLTVGQTVDEFGLENCSNSVQDNWKRGNTESRVDILHAIEPNDTRDMMQPDNKNMAFRSVYMERRNVSGGFLRESGFEEFPVMCPRWDLVAGDIYGTNCPGMDALGDVKALQLHERRKSQAIDKLVNPPLQAPISLQNQVTGGGFLPGEIEFVADMSNGGIRSIYDFRPDIAALGQDIREDEVRVSKAFYEDLFLMLANSDRRQITAREIEERHEEKLLMLGPVLEQIHTELLNKGIKRTFNIMMEAEILPPPPRELQDTTLNIEYISVLAQAQKLTAVAGIERTAGFAAQLAQIWPESRHKIDSQQMIDEYSNAIGLSPKVIRDDDTVKEIEAAEAKQQQMAAMQQTAEMAETGTKAMKNMSETKTETPNALSRAMGLQ